MPDSNFRDLLARALGEGNLKEVLGEWTAEVAAKDYLNMARKLRDELGFEQLIDLCGVDYSTHAQPHPFRYAVVCHLLSLSRNCRLRLRVYAEDENAPCVDSLCEIWPSVDWFEREAFDLFGIIFVGHQDLRRILTDYGFIGHPFRKDFPISGHVEVRYDPELKRVVYQSVSIEPREVVPRTVRESGYGNG